MITRKFPSIGGYGSGSPVTSVNGKVGHVILSPTDIGSVPLADFNNLNSRVTAIEHTDSLVKTHTPTFSNVKFFGELGRIQNQGWTVMENDHYHLPPVLITENINNIPTKVYRVGGVYNRNYSVRRELSSIDWSIIKRYGASFGGVFRLDSTGGNEGVFINISYDDNSSPFTLGKRGRFGFFIRKSKVSNEINLFNKDMGEKAEPNQRGTLDIDIPNTVFDEYNKVEVKLTPNLNNVRIYVNNKDVGELLPYYDKWATNLCEITAMSENTTSRKAYIAEFGYNLYTSDSTLMFGDSDIGAVTKIILPPGVRDYNFIIKSNLSESNAYAGNSLEIQTQNVGGFITITNEDLDNPKCLVNGYANITIPIDVNRKVIGSNVVNNDWRFQVDI